MVLIGIEEKITEVGTIDSVDINDGISTMDTSSASIIVAIGLVSTFYSIKGKSCRCW